MFLQGVTLVGMGQNSHLSFIKFENLLIYSHDMAY